MITFCILLMHTQLYISHNHHHQVSLIKQADTHNNVYNAEINRKVCAVE